jgi:hypothetical protein
VRGRDGGKTDQGGCGGVREVRDYYTRVDRAFIDLGTVVDADDRAEDEHVVDSDAEEDEG